MQCLIKIVRAVFEIFGMIWKICMGGTLFRLFWEKLKMQFYCNCFEYNVCKVYSKSLEPLSRYLVWFEKFLMGGTLSERDKKKKTKKLLSEFQ